MARPRMEAENGSAAPVPVNARHGQPVYPATLHLPPPSTPLPTMPRSTRLLAALISTCSAWCPAQVLPGDIAATGFSASAFGVLRGTTITGYPTTGFLGTGPATSQAVLWDPANPNDFLIGGFGFVGRATIAGPGSASYTLITNNVGIVSQMSWSATGAVVLIDSGSNQVRLLDPVGGGVVDVTAGGQPWGTTLSAGLIDPVSGDLVLGNDGSLFRLTASSGVVTPLASSLGGTVSGITFDPVTGDVIATVLTSNRLVRVDAAGAVTDVAPPFSLPGPNALAVDHNGDFIAAGGTGEIYRVPRAGGSPVYLTYNTSPYGNVNGASVAFGSGYGRPFGSGCLGALGPSELRASGPFQVGSLITTTSTGHAPNAPALTILGLSNLDHLGLPLPLLLDPLLGTSGCSLLASADVLLGGLTTATSPAAFAFALVPNTSFAGRVLYVQHACLEPVPGGLSFSNGLAIHVP